MDNTLFKPRRVAVPLHYSMVSQFMYLWIKWDRPCDLRIQRSEKDKEKGIRWDGKEALDAERP